MNKDKELQLASDLFHDNSETIPTDIDGLNYWAGKDIMTKDVFVNMMCEASKQYHLETDKEVNFLKSELEIANNNENYSRERLNESTNYNNKLHIKKRELQSSLTEKDKQLKDAVELLIICKSHLQELKVNNNSNTILTINNFLKTIKENNNE